MFYPEAVAKVTAGKSKENWWAGATLPKGAGEEGVPIFPEEGFTKDLPFMDREVRYAKHWLASMGIYNYEEPNDPWWSEMQNFMLSIRDGKPIAAPLSVGISDAQAVIYGNRAIETGEKVYWPGCEPQKKTEKETRKA
jgi:hypothetical protein